jgi:serine/threonine protein kinase
MDRQRSRFVRGEIIAEDSRVELKDVSENDRSQIATRGYTLRRELNPQGESSEGSTRSAYYAIKKDGNIERDVVLKIPRHEEDVCSINALINRSRRNIDLQEALISGKIKHPNIVRTVDSFQLEDGRTANAEDFVDGWTVRKFVERSGPIQNRQRFKKTFAPLVDALCYLEDQDVLHRDLSGSNVIIPTEGSGGAVLTDFQNAAHSRDLEELAIPTRGATSETHPILLNALLSGSPAKASQRTEVYSLGAILYEAVTGEKIFDYTLAANPEGRRLLINGREFRVSIRSKGKNLEEISLEDHEHELKTKLKKVPVEFRDLFYGMLTTNEKKSIYSMKSIKEKFEKTTRSNWVELVDKLKHWGMIGGLTFLGGCGVTAGLYTGLYVESHQGPEAPRLSDILRKEIANRVRAEGNWEMAAHVERYAGTSEFDKYYDQALKNKDKLEDDLYKNLKTPNDIANVDHRLTFSLIRSIRMSGTNGLSFDEDRLQSLVPREYVKLSDSISHSGPSLDKMAEQDAWRSWMWMARYIQNQFGYGDSVEEVYAKALCSERERAEAVAKTQVDHVWKTLRDRGYTGIGASMGVPIGEFMDASKPHAYTYFARECREPIKRGISQEKEETILIPGYSTSIDSRKKEIIDRAVLFYTLTDDDGSLHLDRFNQEVFNAPSKNYKQSPISGEDAK